MNNTALKNIEAPLDLPAGKTGNPTPTNIVQERVPTTAPLEKAISPQLNSINSLTAKNTMTEQLNKLFTKIWILFASVILMLATCLLIIYLHIFKLFKKFKLLDPFHDSRRHPLNDPHAPRG